MAHSLTGAMAIAKTEESRFDSEQVIKLRDFRQDDDEGFIPAFTERDVARSGTFGNVHYVDQLQDSIYDHAADGVVRMRVVNADTTRIYKLPREWVEAWIIARNGHPVEIKVPMPGAQEPMLAEPGQRVNLHWRYPHARARPLI